MGSSRTDEHLRIAGLGDAVEANHVTAIAAGGEEGGGGGGGGEEGGRRGGGGGGGEGVT